MTLDRVLGVGRGHPEKEGVPGRADPVRDAAWALGVHPPQGRRGEPGEGTRVTFPWTPRVGRWAEDSGISPSAGLCQVSG